MDLLLLTAALTGTLLCPLQVADVVFSYAVSGECDQVFGGRWGLGDDALKPYRTVMVLSWAKLETAVSTLEQMLLGQLT